jgi:PAS domain S-box-containing protein
MSDSTARVDLIEHFSESVGVEKATQIVDEAAESVGAEGDELGRETVSSICETIRNDYDGYVEIIAQDLLVRTQAEERFHALFEHIPDAAFIVDFVDHEPIVRTVNGAFEDVFGYDADTIVGEPINEFIVPPQERASAERLDRRARQGNRVETEIQRVTADGDRRDFLFRGITVVTPAGNAEGYGIYTDITEQRERQRELERQNEQLERFASVVSHDLRNPLNIANGQLELARETGDRSHLEKVAEAHDRMADLIDKLLTLARQGQTVGEFEACDLDLVAVQAWSTVQTSEATLTTDDGLGRILADEQRLIELLENLFRNAIDHCGDDVEVHVGRLERGFYVVDDGPGIPVAARDRVLESGYTTATDGTGLGLSIVQSIVEAHGWDLSLSEGGQGTRFDITGVRTVED